MFSLKSKGSKSRLLGLSALMTCTLASPSSFSHDHNKASQAKEMSSTDSLEAKASEKSEKKVKEGFDVQVDVEGMVCSFCAQGIEKKMMATEKVEKVSVDMDAKLVYLKFKSEKSLKDAEITEVIVDSGVNVKSILRNKTDSSSASKKQG